MSSRSGVRCGGTRISTAKEALDFGALLIGFSVEFSGLSAVGFAVASTAPCSRIMFLIQFVNAVSASTFWPVG